MRLACEAFIRLADEACDPFFACCNAFSQLDIPHALLA
jgi:hypothetical protein